MLHVQGMLGLLARSRHLVFAKHVQFHEAGMLDLLARSRHLVSNAIVGVLSVTTSGVCKARTIS